MNSEESHTGREELIRDLNRHCDLELPAQTPAEALEDLLAEKLNALILSDFNTVVTILYRVDVNEAKLKELLRANKGEDAGKIMARLILERQAQKIKTRKASASAKEGPAWKD